MQIGANGPSIAADQISRSIQMMNDLNQRIVDTSQETGRKLVSINAEAKVARNEQDVQGQALDIFA